MSIINVENLSKKYLIGHDRNTATQNRHGSFRDAAAHFARGFYQRLRHPFSTNREFTDIEEFWALKDLNFEVQQGERVGIIGRNGAGKSTLLKILSRITEPTSGRIEITDRIASLLEVGTGFHHELSGRENIYLNGAIFGMTRREIKRKFDEIVAFADIGRFIDTPVKRYSSGMYVRLAFAVAAHLEPEILIIDEVLAVGDAAFQEKCLGKMKDVTYDGRTVLFVSHNMAAVRALTDRCLLLQGGKIVALGRTADVINQYLNSGDASGLETDGGDVSSFRRDRLQGGEVEIKTVKIRGYQDSCPRIEMNSPLVIQVHCVAKVPLPNVMLNLVLKDERASPLGILSSWDNEAFIDLVHGENEIEVEIEAPVFAPGRLIVDLGFNQSPTSYGYDNIVDFPLVEIVNSGTVSHWQNRPWGPLHFKDVSWRVNGRKISASHHVRER